MTAIILDGKAAAAAIRADLTRRVASLAGRGVTPGLGTVLVGDDPGSRIYVNAKHRDCAQVGILSIRRDLPADATQQQVQDVVAELNADPACTALHRAAPAAGRTRPAPRPGPHGPGQGRGRPAPGQPRESRPGRAGPLPCTPHGIVELLRRFDVPIAGAEVTVIGRGITVGRSLGLLLTRRSENATVTLCHTGTKDLSRHTRNADIVVVAAGRPGLLTADMIRPGAAVLDVGITRTEAGLLGDVDPAVAEVAGHLAPMPGGVGPMTRAMLLANVVAAAELQAARLGGEVGP